MSDQRELEGGDLLKIVPTKSDKKARLAAVLDRGIVTANLDTSFLPADLHGEWIRYDSNEVARMKALGFSVYSGSHPNALHSASDGTVRVGDVILMTTDKETKAIIDEVQQDRMNKIHGKGSAQIEERTFSQAVDGGIQPLIESRIEEVGADHIASATRGS
jgi:hypothetical protein